MRGELVRYRRLLELARAQRDAILTGRFTDLPGILAERQAILYELSGPRSGGAEPAVAGDPVPGPRTPGGAVVPHTPGGAPVPDTPGDAPVPHTPGDSPLRDAPGGEADATGDEGVDLSEEAREILRAVLEVDRQCRELVWERLKQVEQDLAATRAALQGSRAYRLSLESGPVSRILDELK